MARNTYFVIGRKRCEEEDAEFLFFTIANNGLIFRPRLASAVQYDTVEEAERVLKSARPGDREGCEVLEVIARRRKPS